jgi:phosphoesterase RecJ-like protein
LNLTVESALKFKGYVFNNYKKTKAGVIYLTFKNKTLKRLRVSPSKAGTMVNLLSNVVGYPIWAFFCENADGTCHAEFRSSGPGVQPIVAKCGGGGHFLAAGVTLDDMSDETVAKLIKDCDEAILNYQKEHK